MRTETFKILLVIALYRNWAIQQFDVVAAYVQALLKHDIYITDVNEDGETEYWKLHKALYGLKQASHEWFEMLCDIMKACGMQQCVGDEGTYVSTREQVIVGIHVDDLEDHQERILGALTPWSGALTPALWQLPLEPLVP